MKSSFICFFFFLGLMSVSGAFVEANHESKIGTDDMNGAQSPGEGCPNCKNKETQSDKKTGNLGNGSHQQEQTKSADAGSARTDEH
jgi:hypothetical protein